LRVRGGLPRTPWGRIAAAGGLLLFAVACAGAFMMARKALMRDDRFRIPSSAYIEVQGNEHVTRAQLLSIFGEDVERNIFRISLEERKAQLERLPWVEHATVMRLLPNRLRVAIVERTPVAFLRQGNRIGLVDANGVLLNMPTDVQASMQYSFPVIIGISANDPLSQRAAKMKIYQRFTSDLDRGGETVSRNLSEVDLSDSEDVRALIPDRAGEVLVHFGEDNFLDRYKKFQEHLEEWRTQYPGLSSVDMRYEQQVVLQMKPAGPASSSPTAGAGQVSSGSAAGAVPNPAPAPAATRPKSTPGHKQTAKPAATHSKPTVKHVPPKKLAAQPLHHPRQVVRP
jgi:cell division protein FtsQ